nr:hypothetical protein [Acidiferrobacter sp.]
MAGINAALAARAEGAWWPGRHEAYLGVLVDDLITQGLTEPYRMFTSRAEHRLLLREDNADERLAPVAHRLGLISDTRYREIARREQAVSCEQARLRSVFVRPGDPAVVARLGQDLARESSLFDLLKRPGVGYNDIIEMAPSEAALSDAKAARQLEVSVKYAGYIARQGDEIARRAHHEEMVLPEDLDYLGIRGLSTEVRQRLARHRPATLGQAARLPGVTPAAVSLLLVHLKRVRA